MDSLTHAKNQLIGAKEQVAQLEKAVADLSDSAPAQAVLRVSNALTVAIAREEELTARVAALEADTARAVEEAERADTRGLLSLYDDAPGHSLAHLPRVLQKRIREAVRQRGEDQLLRNRRAGLPGS